MTTIIMVEVPHITLCNTDSSGKGKGVAISMLESCDSIPFIYYRKIVVTKGMVFLSAALFAKLPCYIITSMKYKVTVETSLRDRPKDHEFSAAILIANYFKTDIVFLRASCQHTPDFKIKNAKWELKSPLGNGKNTIKNNLHTAKKQSTNVIIDLRRIKMHQTKAMANIRNFFSSHRSQIKHLVIITKSEEVIELF